jgi:nuclear GTP-binding protein
MAGASSFATLAASLSKPSHPSSSIHVSEQFVDPATRAKRQYIRTLHRVIDQSDVVILVLDARDPDGCRSKVVEEEVKRRESEGKKLMFVLNKSGASLAFDDGSTRVEFPSCCCRVVGF